MRAVACAAAIHAYAAVPLRNGRYDLVPRIMGPGVAVVEQDRFARSLFVVEEFNAVDNRVCHLPFPRRNLFDCVPGTLSCPSVSVFVMTLPPRRTPTLPTPILRHSGAV